MEMKAAELFRAARVAEIDARAAEQIATWRYPTPYELYNGGSPPEHYLNPKHRYFVFWHGERLLGFCCSGEDCRVRGGTYEAGPIDFGLGMHPELTGQGGGAAFLQRVLRRLGEIFPGQAFRLSVASFNARAIRTYERAGFRKTAEFTRADGVPFQILVQSQTTS